MLARPSTSAITVPAVVIVLAAIVRLWGLSSPADMYWDEQHYVFDAEAYLGGGIGPPVGDPPEVRIADEGTWVHPPLGKWMIALLGVGPLGLRSVGWRLPSAIFGIAGVAFLYFLALKLWRSIWWAGLAAFLLALDGLHIVHSRIAMLDIFLTTFITAGILLLVLDRRRMESSEEPASRGMVDRIFGSAYRLGAGLCFGAAIATKWAGVFALALAVLLSSVWIVRDTRRKQASLPRGLATVATSFLAAPLAVYLLSYGAFFYQHGPAIGDFITLQRRILAYHLGHAKLQPENSLPHTWPLLLHPIQYFRDTSGESVRAIFALGNPAVWWGFLALLPVALINVVRRPTWQDAVIFGGYLALYLPWLIVSRSQFLFYMLPAVPFMCLAAVATLRRLWEGPLRILAPVAASIVLVAAVAFAPLWTGIAVPAGWVDGLELLPSWTF
jgi:dolichyl-phosphate-mannose-protein mannosyltransferase